MEIDKVAMRCKDGLVKLRRCPVCHYFVAEATDIVWRRQPKDQADDGEIERCIFCPEKKAVPEWVTLTVSVIVERAGRPFDIKPVTGCYAIDPLLLVRCKRDLQLNSTCLHEGEYVHIMKFSVGVGTVYAIPAKAYTAQVRPMGVWLNAENFELLT